MPLKSLVPLSRKARRGHLERESSGKWPQNVFHIVLWISSARLQKKEKNTKLPESREISYIQRVWRWPCLFGACVYLPALADMLTEGIRLGGKRSEPSDKQRRRFQNSNEASRKWVPPNRSFETGTQIWREMRPLMCVSPHFFDTQVDMREKRKNLL